MSSQLCFNTTTEQVCLTVTPLSQVNGVLQTQTGLVTDGQLSPNVNPFARTILQNYISTGQISPEVARQ